MEVVAQDSCSLIFDTKQVQFTNKHKHQLEAFLAGKEVQSLSILAPILEKDNISKNRYLSELRLQAVKESLLNYGIPFHRMSSNLVLTEKEDAWNTVTIRSDFAPPRDSKILKQTPLVQISEIDYVVRKEVVKEPQEEEKKQEQIQALEDVKKNELLAVDDFKKNETINLPNLLFEGGTHFILPGSENILNELVAVMKAKPKLRIELQGHICCKMGGQDGYDATTGMENLSVMRARVVYLYLLSKGVKKYRMTYTGFGSSRKLYPDDLFNTANAMQNRRVEVLVLGVD